MICLGVDFNIKAVEAEEDWWSSYFGKETQVHEHGKSRSMV